VTAKEANVMKLIVKQAFNSKDDVKLNKIGKNQKT
jgi:hypothetical protein